ncbi:SpvB/TcaC N-terminal domain-containing protein [Flavobacterium aestivum]|uniref:SpvB/TcaC N-terminal domain-containing protein n=1 Tax=Flavobacterium aestivum TaxID=3003257 RepID=UPI0024822F2B|nr:SpvB/TcaC N-terminal domain-containing protein [Flavobacterium aestivum]
MNRIYTTNNRIQYVFFLLFIFACLNAIAQDTAKFLPNITPPSPTAGELGKYGNVPVGMFTGAANISVPLITFKTKDLESPLSLFYGSNGIKVDEVASNVGLGWNLNFGGVITRTVRDKADDNLTGVYPPDNLSTATNAERVQFYKAAGQDNADTERDQYSFNFNGNSGKFVYDKNNEPVLVNHQKIKIQKTGTNNTDFLLTTTNGVKYYFTEKEMTTFRSQGEGHSIISGSVTAWYLSKVVHPNGSEIYFVYDDTNMDYTASNSQTLTLTYPQIQNDCNGVPYTSAPTLSGIVSHNMTVLGKRVNKIYSNNSSDGYILFAYTTSGVNEEVDGNSKINTITQFNANGLVIEKINFNYLKTVNERVFLQNITFIDPSKKYAFEYVNQTEFPRRLATGQDHWGYYNGKNSNTNLVPKNIREYGLSDIDYKGADKEPNAAFAKMGLLSKIIYPTKGYTEFDYESNTYWGDKTTYPAKSEGNIDLSFLDENNDNLDDSPEEGFLTITSPINQRVELTGYVNYVSREAPRYDQYGNPIPDPYDTGHYDASIQMSTVDPSTTFLGFYDITQFGTPHYYQGSFTFIKKVTNRVYFDAEAGKTYKIKLLKNGIRISATLKATYYATLPVTTATNIETGGVRIRSTKDIAEPTARANYKHYYYAPKSDLTHSSGNQGKIPLYLDLSVQRRMCEITSGHVGCLYVNITNLVATSSSVISLFDTGSSNCFYKYVTISEGGDAFENGGETKEFIVNRDDFGNPILGNDIKSAPLTNFGWDNGLEIKSQVLQKRNGGTLVVVAENENNYKLDPSYSNEIKGYNVRKDFNELCPNVQTVENLSIVEYATKSYWFYLQSSVSRKYDLNGLNPVETTTTYGYNNPSHLQLTSQSTKSSLKETLETKYYYPLDLAMASEPFVLDMIANNRIDTPLKTETFRDNTKQSEQKTEYAKDATTSNLLLPKFIYAAKFPNSLSTANSLERKITFDKYDEIGNILQYTLESGTPVAIIWGYNKTKPIAKIENATYDQASAAYTTNDNIFRNSLPNAMITTYTYIPLVGIKTITDPKGQVTTYDYDDFNRLKLMKDSQGKIVTENQYHYKN